MKSRILQLILAAAFSMHGIWMPASSGSAGEDASRQTRYINSWSYTVINDQNAEVNEHNWQKYSEDAARSFGVNEISLYPPGAQPTPQQIKAADELIEKTKAAAQRHNWANFGQSLKDGYVVYDTSHYFNLEYANDDRTLDPDRPENLMYYWNKDGELKLVGVMYLLKSHTEHGPQVGGPLTTWHFHTMAVPYCWDDGPYNPPKPDGSCQRGAAELKSAEMLHVWLVDHPDGPFATAMGVPQEVVDSLP